MSPTNRSSHEASPSWFSRLSRRGLRRSFVTRSLITAVLALLGLTLAAQPTDTVASKLTTVLADLSRAVPQDAQVPSQLQVEAQGRITLPGVRPVTALDVDRLPKSVQDAIRGRRLRSDANNQVQVYILMRAVTDETMSELTAA